MAHKSDHARKDRVKPGERENAKGDHAGSAHTPDEFDALNPQKQGPGTGKAACQSGKPH